MVNEKAIGGIHNLPVNRNHFCFVRCNFEAPEGIFIFEEPFEIAKTVVILRVEDCEFAFAEVNPAICVAETEEAIGEKGTGANTV